MKVFWRTPPPPRAPEPSPYDTLIEEGNKYQKKIEFIDRISFLPAEDREALKNRALDTFLKHLERFIEW